MNISKSFWVIAAMLSANLAVTAMSPTGDAAALDWYLSKRPAKDAGELDGFGKRVEFCSTIGNLHGGDILGGCGAQPGGARQGAFEAHDVAW